MPGGVLEWELDSATSFHLDPKLLEDIPQNSEVTSILNTVVLFFLNLGFHIQNLARVLFLTPRQFVGALFLLCGVLIICVRRMRLKTKVL